MDMRSGKLMSAGAVDASAVLPVRSRRSRAFAASPRTLLRCPMPSRPTTLSELREAVRAGTVARRTVRDEVRANLIARIQANETLFPGIIGYDETVVPQIVNAVLS